METIQLVCDVDSYPPSEVFSWTFNSSGEQTELPTRLQPSLVFIKLRLKRKLFFYFITFYSQTRQSHLNYTPTTEMDYGSISCWATNELGKQHRPCTFQIVAAGEFFINRNMRIAVKRNVYGKQVVLSHRITALYTIKHLIH